ncbi:unnamed protein product [Arctia plantaginis]|uniref:Uncharacterized protein n=1 Tax=Arctia plantaginis TaxID=874455 RepID=A0A8S1ABN5_ARCPL|nr:unnamed protein product [Arctia plantaginis]
MDPLARLMEGAPLPGVLGATRDARPRGALVHASLAAAPAIGDKKGRHLTGTFCLTGDTMEGIIQCLVFLKAFSYKGLREGEELCQLLMKAEITSRLYFVYLDNAVFGIIILKVVASLSSISKIRVWYEISEIIIEMVTKDYKFEGNV